MAGKQGQTSTIAWVAVCLLAAGIGFYAGSKQPGQPAPAPAPLAAARPRSGEVVLTSHTVSDIAKSCDPWVATIETEPLHGADLPEHIIPELGAHGMPRGAGTGIVIRPDGYIVTSNHVLGVQRKVNAVLSNHRRYSAKIVGRDWLTDVAVLKIDAIDLPYANLAEHPPVEPGDWALAIGTPMRLDHTVSLGIVSAVNRTISDTSVPGTDLIQTDAAINPGNSGGPLLNIHGQVIGMNTAVHRTAQNIAFAVPADLVDEVACALINEGKVARGYLGLYMSTARDSAPPPNDQQDGVYVILAVKDGPAAKAGLSAGDIIKAINSKPVQTNGDVRRIVLPLRPGEHIAVQVLHNGQLQTMGLTLGQAPEYKLAAELQR